MELTAEFKIFHRIISIKKFPLFKHINIGNICFEWESLHTQTYTLLHRTYIMFRY